MLLCLGKAERRGEKRRGEEEKKQLNAYHTRQNMHMGIYLVANLATTGQNLNEVVAGRSWGLLCPSDTIASWVGPLQIMLESWILLLQTGVKLVRSVLGVFFGDAVICL